VTFKAKKKTSKNSEVLYQYRERSFF